MTCSVCGDHGIIRLNWADEPEDYAICVCPSGLAFRSTRNHKRTVPPLWVIWAARNHVDPKRIYHLEDVLSDDEMRERGLHKPVSTVSREAALLAAGRKR